MTTNHPAHGPVSLERLHQIREILSKAAAQSDGGNLGYAMADAVKVIDGVIAAFGAEPVAWRYRYVKKGITDSQGESWVGDWKYMPTKEDCNDRPSYEIQALYAAPPAPVVPTFDEWLELRGNKPLGWVKDAMRESYDACRAAMLQAGNHTEQHLDMVDHSGDANEKVDCRLTFDQWLSQQNEPIDVDCGCVSTEAFYHWLRVAYEAANYPVTPDTWIPVSERMPPSGGSEQRYVLAADFRNHYWPNIPNTQVGVYGDWFNDGNPTWDDGDGEDLHLKEVTHWMPLPAAPQQEVKSALEHGMQRYSGAMQKLSEGDK